MTSASGMSILAFSNLRPQDDTPLSRRRAYDRSLKDAGHQRTAASPSAYPGTHAGHWEYEARRRPGATHAWGQSHPPGSRYGQHGPYWHGDPRASPFTHPKATPEHHQDPFGSPHVRRATGHNPFRHHGSTEADRMNHVSSFWRAVQVIGVVMIVATVGGGLRASA